LAFSGNVIDADIGLRRPFLGLNQFTGFDVKGILISDGSLNGFTDSDVNIPGMGDTRLLNPDGYTLWWNPNEFPDIGTIFGYIDGVLGQPYDIAGFTATLNWGSNLDAIRERGGVFNEPVSHPFPRRLVKGCHKERK